MVSDLVSPFVAELFNRSMASGQVPSCFKHAYIAPIVKKAGLDNTDPSSYRPISNLLVLSDFGVLDRHSTPWLSTGTSASAVGSVGFSSWPFDRDGCTERFVRYLGGSRPWGHCRAGIT